MNPQDFEPTVASALSAQLGTELERFSLRREVSGPVDAVANVRGERRSHKGPRAEPGSGFESIRVKGSRITARLGTELLTQLAAAVEQAHADQAYGGRPAGEERILLDFCDPNANKPLHLGHLRNLAIGAGLLRLMDAAGAQVRSQQVLGDVGRNVAEALAGVERFGDAPPRDLKTDHWVGACYARYVRQLGASAADGASPDAPIARELQAHGDLADQLLSRWLQGDPAVRDRWKTLVDGVSAAQRRTLERLGIAIDRVLLESDGALQAPAWLETALRAGAVRRCEDGAIVFETGRESYPALLLTRPDGVPTEHMRAVPLWAELQAQAGRHTRCLHVMGAEWLVTTELREALIRRLGPAPLYDRYLKLAHGFVTVAGSKMKSSDGQALTIDQALDLLTLQPELRGLVAQSRGAWRGDALAAALMSATLLGVPLPEPCEIDPDSFCTVHAHPAGWVLLRASLVLAQDRPRGGFRPEHDEDRHLLLQAARLPGFLDRALDSGDPCELLRFIQRVAQQVLNHPPQSRAAACAADWVLSHGLRLLGLGPLLRAP